MSSRFSRKQRDGRVCDGLFIGCLDDTFDPDTPASGNEHDETKKQQARMVSPTDPSLSLIYEHYRIAVTYEVIR